MQMTLRPGEALVWRWGHLKPAKYMSPKQFVYPDNICNGLWEYRPDFGGEAWKKGALKVDNVASGPEGLAAGNGKTGTVVWKIASPYAFVGGHLEAEASGARFAVSSDGTKWTDIAGQQLRQVLSAGRQSVLPVSTALRNTRRSQIKAPGGHQRPADGPARTARDDGR